MEIKNYKYTNGAYGNNATTIYGELDNGNMFIYVADTGYLEVYKGVTAEELQKHIYILYDFEMDEYERKKLNHDFIVNYEINIIVKERCELIDKLQEIYNEI